MDRSVREPGTHAFGPFRLDPVRRTLTRQGEPLELTPTVFDLLLYLVENAGRVVSKEEILDHVWPRRTVEESNIRQGVFTLRKALRYSGSGELIATAPGQGYRFTGAVRLDAGSLRVGGPPAPGARFGAAGPSFAWVSRSPARLVAVLAAAALVVAAPIFWLTLPRPHAPTGPHLGVVVEFQNLTQDPIFDHALAKALQIDLEQSPLVEVETDRQVQDALARMTRPRDEPLTPATADEVCARNNGQAVVDGTIAALGTKYLLTLTATQCAGGAIMAAEKAQIGRREEVVPALDALVRHMRRKLGEPDESIHRYDTPLAQEKTASLEALEAFSQASVLQAHGRPTDALPLYQRAIALDPRFAGAYVNLSSVYVLLGRHDLEAASLTKAYELRDGVGARAGYRIASRYHHSVTRDLDEELADLRLWAQAFPDDPNAWSNLANIEDLVGQPERAAEDGRRALALDAHGESSYFTLAQAYRRCGRLAEAKAVIAQATAKGLAGPMLAYQRYLIALVEDDAAGADRAKAETRGTVADALVRATEAELLFGQGRLRQGRADIQQLAAIDPAAPAARPGLWARYLVDLGRPDLARALLAGHAPSPDDPGELYARAWLDEPSRIRSSLEASLRLHPQDTLLNRLYAPQVLAILDLRRRLPADALRDLAPALAFRETDVGVSYLLGQILLAQGDGTRAAEAFGFLLGHRQLYPAFPLYPAARIGLARALRVQGDVAGSRRAYEAAFAELKDADADLPILIAAKAEYAALPRSAGRAAQSLRS
jgi:DNA-binding winged helix-turn-helix (wHTH) protein/tetratricopeptide (TPR) repeat protein